MSIYKMPYLEPYSGRDSRHTCPSCKHEKTFTFYINGETDVPINPTVGKCDREIKCGYHYTPREFFRDNPQPKKYDANRTKTTTELKTEFTDKPEKADLPIQSKINYYNILQDKIDLIPRKYVIDSASFNSNFVNFLFNYFPKDKIEEAVLSYALGATRNGRVIFWQIDCNDNVRTGKIMQYNRMTGKRIRNVNGAINWAHNILKKRSYVYSNYKLSQCYFGEHLLRLYPKKPVAIVEAEKTAVIGSMIYTDFIWLAAGNLNGLNIPKSKILKDRYVMLYPDAGCYEKWFGKMKRISSEVHCEMDISDMLEKKSTPQQLESGYDIADYVIDKLSVTTESNTLDSSDNLCSHDSDLTQSDLKTQNNLSPDLQKMIFKNPSLTELIKKFDLEEMEW